MSNDDSGVLSMSDLAFTTSVSRRARKGTRRIVLAPLTALVFVAGLLIGVPVPTDALTSGGPGVMTTGSWYGVKLGDSLNRVARVHGWSAGSCLGGSVPDYIRVPRTYGVAIARGARAGRVGFIEAYRKQVGGPHGVRVGVRVSSVAGFLDTGTEHHADEGIGSGNEWRYWVIPVRSHYFYVRAGSLSPRSRVISFGLAVSRSVANERGRTQGGCY
ncbi:hypothetical protein [Nocardioides sp.]|uniref:hypothetical protein n=1 Tax=Nocardioides sp. TaxID=35761 RepID=UPI0037844C95